MHSGHLNFEVTIKMRATNSTLNPVKQPAMIIKSRFELRKPLIKKANPVGTLSHKSKISAEAMRNLMTTDLECRRCMTGILSPVPENQLPVWIHNVCKIPKFDNPKRRIPLPSNSGLPEQIVTRIRYLRPARRFCEQRIDACEKLQTWLIFAVKDRLQP